MSRQEKRTEPKLQPSDDVQLNDGLNKEITSYWEEEKGKKFQGYREDGKSGPKKKKKKPLKIIGLILLILVIFVAVVVLVFFILQNRGKKELLDHNAANTEIAGSNDADLSDGGMTVVYKGETYKYDENVTAILCMGIDREEFREDGEAVASGQADSLFLMVVDTSDGSMTMLPISRNTMVTIDEYDGNGKYIGQDDLQVTLAYAYGDGRTESCENVVTAISRLMYGMPISSYIAIDMSGISVLNDAVGGVEVQVLEDLSAADAALVPGNTVTLKGEQSVIYVRSRKSEGTDLEIDNNAPRMERQVQYLNSFMKKALTQTKSNPTLPISLFQMMGDYMITDITPSEVTYLASLVVQHGLDNKIVSIPGTAKKGKYTEVYVDNEALYEIILDVFYNKVAN